MQAPTIGRIVIVPVDSEKAGTNGQGEAPAIITGVFSGTRTDAYHVNVRVFLDGHDVEWRTSQLLLDAEPELHDPTAQVCWWPKRETTSAAM